MCRASTPCSATAHEGVDGRDKPGHDEHCSTSKYIRPAWGATRAVIAKSEVTKQSSVSALSWIASLRSQCPHRACMDVI
ncbi:hypothetical protein D4Q52_16470 [Rhodopseudomonas palustris]|uniref:Uncharacterized protein n=1 Tax=Rhodopseudomonas palustris TaxID=1076 RepID=A0A418V3N4_RHOPL|nr:hypothetical protein D4Q52_16470 [Rhodopseudomonas palustris]